MKASLSARPCEDFTIPEVKLLSGRPYFRTVRGYIAEQCVVLPQRYKQDGADAAKLDGQLDGPGHPVKFAPPRDRQCGQAALRATIALADQ